MAYRVTTGTGPGACVVPGLVFSDALAALTKAKQVYPTLPGTLAVYDDHGQGLKPRRSIVLPSWTIVDAITPESWDAAHASVKEWGAMQVPAGHDDLETGLEIVDQGHVLVTRADGGVGVYLDADGDGIPELPAPGDWQFRFAGQGAFDTPYGNARLYQGAAPGIQVEAEDGDGELPTLGAIYQPQTDPFPAPSLRPAMTDATTGRVRLPSPTDPAGPFAGADVLIIHDRYHPVGFANPQGIPQAILDADGYRYQHDNAYRTAQMYVARPPTQLLDDDGHSAGYYFKGIRGGYEYADRLCRVVHDRRDGVQVFDNWLTPAPDTLAAVSPFALGQGGKGALIKPGLVDWYVWQETLVPASLPAGVSIDGGARPYVAVADNTPDPGYVLGTPWFYWQTGIWAEAVYVYRDSTGYEREYTSRKVRTSLTLCPWLTYPTLPSLYAFAAPYVTGLQGAFTTWSGNASGTDGQYHAPGSVYPYDFIKSGCADGDGPIAVFDDIPGALRYHFWRYCFSAPTPGIHRPPASAPINGDALNEFLYTGVDYGTQNYTSTNDHPDIGTLAGMGIAGRDWLTVIVSYDPVFDGLSNGGTVVGEVDTVAYINIATGQAAGCQGGGGMQLVKYWRPILAVHQVSDGAGGFKQDPNLFRTRAVTAGLSTYNRDKTRTHPPASVGPSNCGSGIILGPPPPPAPDALYKGRAWVWTHLFRDHNGTFYRPHGALPNLDNAGSASFMTTYPRDAEQPGNAGSASFMRTWGNANPGAVLDNGGSASFGPTPTIVYINQDDDAFPTEGGAADINPGDSADNDPVLVSIPLSDGRIIKTYARPQRKP